MNRLAQPPTQSASALAEMLKPVLQSTLNSLNVQLDQELARYRAIRRGHALPTETFVVQAQRPGLDLISVQAGQRRSPIPPPVPPNPRLHDPAGAGGTAQPSLGTNAYPEALIHQPSHNPSHGENYLASSEALLESLQYSGGAMPQAVSQKPSADWTAWLNTPLGLGGLLLLLVASAGLGYGLMYPEAIARFLNNTPFAARPGQPDAALETTSGATDTATSQPKTGLEPDLSQQEFKRLDLRSLSTLSPDKVRDSSETTLPPPESLLEASTTLTTPNAVPSSPPLPTVVTTPIAPPRPALPAPVVAAPPAAPPAPARPAVAAPPTAAAPPAALPAPRSDRPEPSPAPVATPPAPVTSAAPSYYVVTDYTGDPSLGAARAVVGDAYVRNFPIGARIQLGTFASEAEAAAQVQTLQNQGINAQIYTP